MDWETTASDEGLNQEEQVRVDTVEEEPRAGSNRILLHGLNIHQVPGYLRSLEIDLEFQAEWQKKNSVILVFDSSMNATRALQLLTKDGDTGPTEPNEFREAVPFSCVKVRLANPEDSGSSHRIRWPGGQPRDLYRRGARVDRAERGRGGWSGRGRGRGGYYRGLSGYGGRHGRDYHDYHDYRGDYGGGDYSGEYDGGYGR